MEKTWGCRLWGSLWGSVWGCWSSSSWRPNGASCRPNDAYASCAGASCACTNTTTLCFPNPRPGQQVRTGRLCPCSPLSQLARMNLQMLTGSPYSCPPLPLLRRVRLPLLRECLWAIARSEQSCFPTDFRHRHESQPILPAAFCLSYRSYHH